MAKGDNGGTFKAYQGGHYTGNQKCGQEHFPAKKQSKPMKDTGKTSSRAKSKKY